jgi:hypothetical protein
MLIFIVKALPKPLSANKYEKQFTPFDVNLRYLFSLTKLVDL